MVVCSDWPVPVVPAREISIDYSGISRPCPTLTWTSRDTIRWATPMSVHTEFSCARELTVKFIKSAITSLL